MNQKQKKVAKLESLINLLDFKYEVCRGDIICCGKKKPVIEFSPSNLKCICRECIKKIIERNRQDKIDKNENHYIYEKIRNTVLRESVFSSILKCSDKFFYAWIKSQSVNAFNEHFDHVLPIHYFKKFSNASPYLLLRDSWINFMPIKAEVNLKKGTKVDYNLFSNQLDKAIDFINKYEFDTNQEKYDMQNYYDNIIEIFNSINR